MEKQVETIQMPLLGDPFPEIHVQTTHGTKNIPADYKGQWFVLFSHPADFTPVCTTEFYSFQKHYKDFQDRGCELVGMSIDQIFSHIKWVQWIEEKLGCRIEFPVIAGTETIAKKLGMLHPAQGANTVRAVFIVDPEGTLRQVLYYPQEAGRNIKEILRSVKALQQASGVAVPANWPDNELIGDNVIIPPAKDEDSAKANADKYENYDWWFCHCPCK